MAVELGCALEPRVIIMVLTNIVGKVIHADAHLKRAWYDKIIQSSLRTPHNMWDVLPCVRTMAGE
eukprot:8713031-Prorocentrum_lima.AAC.1